MAQLSKVDRTIEDAENNLVTAEIEESGQDLAELEGRISEVQSSVDRIGEIFGV